MSSIIANFQSIQAFHKAGQIINEAKNLWFQALQSDIPITHGMTILGTINSFINFGSTVESIKKIRTIKGVSTVACAIVEVAKRMSPLYPICAHAEYVLSATITVRDIASYVVNDDLYTDESRTTFDYLRVASSIFLLSGSILGHIKNAVLIQFLPNTSRITLKILSRHFGYFQLGLGVVGGVLDLANQIRKIWRTRSISLSELLYITAGTVLLSGALLDCIPIPVLKIISISCMLIGNSLLFFNHYICLYKWDRSLYKGRSIA